MRIRSAAAGLLLPCCFPCGAGIAQAAQAQWAGERAAAYPVRPIRMIVPSSPGGGTDITARLVASALTRELGQQVIVDNRAGATGNIGAVVAARAAPDGYTLLAFANTLTADAGSKHNLPYDLVQDFAPITQTTSLPYLLVIHPSVQAKSVPELIALAKAKPGGISYSSSGIGGLSHLSGALLGMLSRTDLLHVPYKGGAPALADLLAGQVNMLFSSPLQAAPHLRSGKLVALAVTSRARLKSQPALPTMMEAGIAGYEVDVSNGLVAPAGLPARLVTRIHAATVAALESLRGQLAADGSEVVGSAPEVFREYLKADIAKWRRISEHVGLRLE